MNAILMARARAILLSRLALEGLSTRAEIPAPTASERKGRKEGRKKKRRIIDSAPFLPRATPVPLKVALMMTAIEG